MTAITIDHHQRTVLYDELMLDLTGLDDIRIELDAGNSDQARLLRTRYHRDLRLLDDLGWACDTTARQTALTIAPKDLAAILRHIATGALARVEHPDATTEAAEHACSGVQTLRVCHDLLYRLASAGRTATEFAPEDMA